MFRVGGFPGRPAAGVQILEDPTVSALRSRSGVTGFAGANRRGRQTHGGTLRQSTVSGGQALREEKDEGWFGARLKVKKLPPKLSSSCKIPELDKHPILVALAGPNGAGKTTFYEAHLKATGLRFLNADVLAGELGIDAYQAAEIAAQLRREFVSQKESFVFETVFSDPVGDKLAFLKQAAQAGYAVILCFIGLQDADRSEQRVAMRVSQGGHDVPTDKLTARFPRTMTNLKQAIQELPRVLVFDNDDLRTPYQLAAIFQNEQQTFLAKPTPRWLNALKIVTAKATTY